MAKCGCVGTGCSCLLVGGAGIVIRGAGTVTNPYVIDAAPVNLEVSDTATINLTLTGVGTPTDPLHLSAAFIGSIPVPDKTPAESRSWASGTVSLADVLTPRTIRVTLSANVTTVTLPTWASSDSGSITLILMQDAVGSRTWPTPGTTEGGANITLTTTPLARDVVRLFWTGVQWVVTPVAMNVS